MEETLSASQVKALIKNAIDGFPHAECATCECFLGYLTQLEIDADPSSQPILLKHKPDRLEIHTCLGCDPCPPADYYAEYLRNHRKR